MGRTLGLKGAHLNTYLLSLVFVVFLAGVTGCSAGSSPQQRTKAVLRLDFLTSGYHAPFWVALEKGWYVEKGIDLEIVEGQGSAATVKTVASGSDTFGLVDGPTMVQGIAQGMPLKSIASFWQKSPSAVVVHGDVGVSKPKDLEGKKLGFAPGSAQETLWPAFAAANKIDVGKVQVITTDIPSKVRLLVTKEVDFLVTQIVAIPRAQAQASDLKLVYFLYSDYGLDLTGYSLTATDQTIKEKPELVKGFVTASIAGWKWARENPEQAVAILKKYRPDAPPLSLEEFKITFGLFDSPNTQGKPAGWQSRESWQSTISLLNSLGTLKQSPAGDSVFTNAFVPEK